MGDLGVQIGGILYQLDRCFCTITYTAKFKIGQLALVRCVDHTWSWLLSHVLLLLVDYLPMSRSKYTGRVMQANPSHELWRLYEV